MSDLVFSSPAKREKFLKSIAFHQAKIAAKQAAKQLDFFGPPVAVNGAVPAVTAPAVPGQLVGLPKRTYIELKPFDGPRGGGCHWAVITRNGFMYCGCMSNVFDAACRAFHSVRLISRAQTFPVLVHG